MIKYLFTNSPDVVLHAREGLGVASQLLSPWASQVSVGTQKSKNFLETHIPSHTCTNINVHSEETVNIGQFFNGSRSPAGQRHQG